jgi:hypothetical protein
MKKMKEADPVTGKQEVYTIAPSGLLPYLSGETDMVEKALFLRRFGAPFWGLTYVFGRDDQYWYRLTAQSRKVSAYLWEIGSLTCASAGPDRTT